MTECSEEPRFVSSSLLSCRVLKSVVANWRSDGEPDDWWQEAIGEDGKVYDVNIYDTVVFGGEGDDGYVYCIYATRKMADGFRETDVIDILERGLVASLDGV